MVVEVMAVLGTEIKNIEYMKEEENEVHIVWKLLKIAF